MEKPFPVRKSMRLENFDYSTEGVYFLTLCSKNKEKLFSQINGFDTEGIPLQKLTGIGKQIEYHIQEIPNHYSQVNLEHYVVMPNHIHLLLSVAADNGVPGSSRPTQLVPRIISALKRFTNQAAGKKIWQDSYMDHVIRNKVDFWHHWNYIENNPFRWAEDEYFE